MSNEVDETFLMNLAGRDVRFRRVKIGQVLILRRLMERLKQQNQEEGEGSGDSVMLGIIKTLDFVESLIVSPDDRQFVEDQMLAGTIDHNDVFKALGSGIPDEPADDEPVKPPKKAPRKSPKAPPVDLTDKKPAQIVPKPKTVASRGRTKR